MKIKFNASTMSYLLPVAFLWTAGSILYSFCFFAFSTLRRIRLSIDKTAILCASMLLVIFGLSLFSAYFEPSNSISMENFKFLFFALAFFTGALNKTTNLNRDISVFVTIVVLYSIVTYIIRGNHFAISQEGLFYLPDQNNLAILLCFFIPVVIRKSSITSMMFMSSLLFFYFMMVSSRAGVLILAAYLVFLFRSNPRIFLLIFILGPAFVLLATMNFGDDAKHVVTYGNYSDNLRALIWLGAIFYFLSRDNWLLGYGGGDFGSVVNLRLERELEVHHAHNMFLEVLMSYGALACLVLVLFFVVYLYRMLTSRQYEKAIQICILLLFSMIETIVSDSRIFVCICFYMGMSFNTSAPQFTAKEIIK